jgi:hypothetical protein
MNDNEREQHISGTNGGDFFDELARALAQHVTFENHGTLSDDERAAFLWGFRHGVHHLRGLLIGAESESPAALRIIRRIVDEAVCTWELNTTSVVLAVPREKAANDTKH